MKNITIEQRDNTTYRRIRCMLSCILILAIAIGPFGQYPTAYATTTTTGSYVNVSVDYLEEIAVVTSGTGSTKFYMSTDNQKTWEVIDTSGVVDLSSLLQTKDTIVYFKGNKDTNPYKLTLQGENKDLKVTYGAVNGEGKVTLSIPSGVIYRKGVNGVWKTAVNQMSTAIYEIKGATLYFRVQATSTKRAGKVVTLKIPKRPSAPSVKLDGSKLAFTGVKAKETQYRVGDSTTWSTYLPVDTKAKSIDLLTLLASNSVANTALPAGVIEFRTMGTNKKATSGIKVIEIAAQRTVPETIAVSGSTITISDTATTNSYEYTKVEKNMAFNMSTAKWTAISSKNSVVVPKISIGDKILVRLKSMTDKTTKQIILASTYKEFTVSSLTLKSK